MKETVFIIALLALILLGFYSMECIDSFLRENYRREWEIAENAAFPSQPHRHTLGLSSLLRCGTIFLQKHTIKHYRW